MHAPTHASSPAHGGPAAPGPELHAEEHAHPGPGIYFRIGVVLFVLTALEVGLYELTFGAHGTPDLSAALHPFFVPLLLILSAGKFALVAMYYMHLKQDSRLFTGLLVFPLIIAAVTVIALAVLMAYHHTFARSG
jgi:cytochrome c oxidase subunit 4